MADYQLCASPRGPIRMVQRLSDNAFIPFDDANKDYAQYLADVRAGAVVLNVDGTTPAPYVSD